MEGNMYLFFDIVVQTYQDFRPRPSWRPYFIQLNKYETEPYFLQFFQSNTTVCLIIHVFCESCDPEIVLNSDPSYYAQY